MKRAVFIRKYTEMIQTFDTVFAPSSAIGGAICVIRVSGEQTRAIAEQLLDKPVSNTPGRMRHTQIRRNGTLLDD